MKQLLITTLFAALLIGCGKKEGTSKPAPLEEETAKPAPPNVDVFKAAGEGNLDALKQHISAGTDLNQRTQDGQKTTPLIAAAALGRVEAAKVLIEAKADLNLQNKDGSTALHTAAFLCHPEIVEALLKAGADKAIKTNTGATALDGALIPWDEVKPLYDFLNGILYKPIGMPLDYDRIQQTRPKIAEMLR
jgi:ankyrin repeat protein